MDRKIRNKMLKKYNIRGKYYHIVVDGTGLATSKKKYNANCLVKNKTDKKENVSKQDCEINAFKRLAKKIKTSYPRLKIIIGADALYRCRI